MILQLVRRTVQGLTIIVMTAVVVLSLYAHYRSARVIDDPDLMKGLRGEVITQAIHPLMDELDDPEGFLDANKGTLWSMRLLGVELTDPLAALEMIASSKTIYWPLIASIVVPVVLTVLLGRVFCSWICPGYVLFEAAGKLRKLLRFAEIRPGEVRFSHANKYIVLAVGLCVAAIASAPLFALIYPPAVISRAVHAWIFGTAMTGIVVLLAAIVAVELLVSPRWWCRSVCPGGALYALLGWARPLRVRLRREACTGCRDCIPVCEAGINPITQSSSIECDNCGVCIRHCGDGALYFAVGLPQRKAAPSAATQTRRTGGNTIVAVVFLLALGGAPASAQAHHILGLPHYSYKENYPQRPTLEYPATTGPYDVLLTSYPGIPTPGEPANLAFYIKNRDTDRVYDDVVSVRVLQTHTFGDNTVIQQATTRALMDNEYKFHVTLPVDGEYVVELSMPVEGRVEVLPFLVTAGKPSAAASFVVAGSFGVLVLWVVLRAIQKKKHRRLRVKCRPSPDGPIGTTDGLSSVVTVSAPQRGSPR